MILYVKNGGRLLGGDKNHGMKIFQKLQEPSSLHKQLGNHCTLVFFLNVAHWCHIRAFWHAQTEVYGILL